MKGTTQVMNHKREEIVRLRDMGHSGNNFVLRFSQKTRCWRAISERNCTFAISGSVKHDDKIMAWGRFAAHGVGELVLIDGIMDQHQYIDILRTAVRRSADCYSFTSFEK